MDLIGHRGARFEAPENILSGFRYAIALGLTAVEFDVRMTFDDHLVVIHDATVDRTTNGTGEVASLTLAEIQRSTPAPPSPAGRNDARFPPSARCSTWSTICPRS